KTTYYYGNTIASTPTAFTKAYKAQNIDKDGNHIEYNDHLGHPTIGDGHLIKEGEKYELRSTVTEEEAQKLYENDSRWIINKADSYLKKFNLSGNQKNALYDAAFNMGRGKLSQYIEDGSKYSHGNFFLKFMAGGDGIKKRRYAENILYNEGVSIHLDVLKGKTMKQIDDYLKSLLKDEKENN